MEKETKYKIVIVGGFGGSGSSAVIDLLSEFDVFKEFKTEFRLLVDPDGIMNLENALVYNWSPYQSDTAIKRFKRLINVLGGKYKFPYLGINHTKNINKGFINLSYEYIDKLLSFSYNGMWLRLNNPRWYISREIRGKIMKIFGLKLYNYYEPIYISFKKDKFISITKSYLEKLFSSNINNEKIKFIMLDEGYASLNPSRVLKYFDYAKMIIVHRDPRDTFVGALKNGFYFMPLEVKTFIKWHKCLQEQTYICSNTTNKILRIQFEDLVLKYDKTLKNILQFLSIKKYKHIHKKKYFNQSVSINNVGIWKNYKNQNEMKLIKEYLGKYCYQFKK